ncbi:MAG: LuxR C-terminal-related transcriptional regulator [Anaerolineae bacterium]
MDALLRTKLFVPPLRPELVPRPRLSEQLSRVLDRKVVLVSAPAGFGKTTLANAWVREQKVPVAWLTLDEGDNDLARFLIYLEAALREVHPEIGETLSAHLESLQDREPHVESLLASLANRLLELPHPILLVLDDLHLIEAYAVHEALAYFVAHLPPQMHLLLLTREDPPLPLARLRVRGEMSEVRAADLRFSRQESAQFLNEIMDLDLASEDVVRLEERTEGWAAGLQLAALALRTTASAPDARHDFIADFAGDDRLVMDYLIDEVLASQPDAVQAFLLQTSILDRFCAPLCDAVRAADAEGDQRIDTADVPLSQPIRTRTAAPDVTDSQAILNYLERANLFVTPLDHRRRWYRYHHLFRDLLRYRLQRRGAEQVNELHRRAGAWFSAQELLDEAIHHLLTAEAYEQLADLIGARWQTMMIESRTRLYLACMRALPPEVIETRPMLSIADAWAYFLSDRGDSEDVERRLTDAENALDPAHSDETTEVAGHAAALRSVIVRKDPTATAKEIIRLSEEAQHLLPDNDLVRYITDLNLSSAYLVAGKVDRALRVLGQAYASERCRHNPYLGVTIASVYGQILFEQGKLRAALALYRDTVDKLTDSPWEQRSPFAELAYGGIGRVLVEMNDLEGAAQMLTDDPHRFPPGDEIMEMYVHLAHARLCWAQGDTEGARRALAHAREGPFAGMDVYVDAFEAQRAIRQGRMEPAQAWARFSNVTLQATPLSGAILRGTLPTLQRATLVRLRIAQQREGVTPDTALPSMKAVLDFLERQITLDETSGWNGRVLDLLMLQALAFAALGQPKVARQALRRALALAEPAGYVRVFLEEGAPMAHLLYELAAEGESEQDEIQAYARRLLSAFETAPPPEKATSPETPDTLVEPLSERELEVLALIAKGLTNPEIAERLFISIHTVKSHASNLYSKLLVSNRTQAVQKARLLGLLPPH